MTATAKKRYDKRRRVLMATGRWNPWADGQAVRDHIAGLSKAGIGWMRAAELAGLSTATVSGWLYGHNGHPRPKRVQAELAAKMLAVTAHEANLADRALVNPLVTVRQIKALAADGFPMRYIAQRLGVDSTNLSRIMRNAHVEAGTARAIADLFAALAGTDPAAAGVSARNISYIRNWATKKSWWGSAAWSGEISNPDADPASWVRGHTDGRTAEALVAEADEIKRTWDVGWDLIAERLGIPRNTLDQARKRVRDRKADATRRELAA